MSKRLHVFLPDHEMADIQRLANREQLTVGEWVRRALREARADKPSRVSDIKLRAVRRAAELCCPIGDIDQILAEIERGSHD